MTSPDQERDEPRARPERTDPGGAGEVRAYLVKLVALILVGLCLMTGAAVIAWQLYADKLAEQEEPRRESDPAPRPTGLPAAP